MRTLVHGSCFQVDQKPDNYPDINPLDLTYTLCRSDLFTDVKTDTKS
jgi:hypothetical protein